MKSITIFFAVLLLAIGNLCAQDSVHHPQVAVRVRPLGILNSTAEGEVECTLDKATSVQVRGGYIGLLGDQPWTKVEERRSGYLLGAGIKIGLDRNGEGLKKTYVMPEVAWSSFTFQSWEQRMEPDPATGNMTMQWRRYQTSGNSIGAFLLMGQTFQRGHFTADVRAGVGLAGSGVSSGKTEEYWKEVLLPRQRYAFFQGGRFLPISHQMRITMGYAF